MDKRKVYIIAVILSIATLFLIGSPRFLYNASKSKVEKAKKVKFVDNQVISEEKEFATFDFEVPKRHKPVFGLYLSTPGERDLNSSIDFGGLEQIGKQDLTYLGTNVRNEAGEDFKVFKSNKLTVGISEKSLVIFGKFPNLEKDVEIIVSNLKSIGAENCFGFYQLKQKLKDCDGINFESPYYVDVKPKAGLKQKTNQKRNEKEKDFYEASVSKTHLPYWEQRRIYDYAVDLAIGSLPSKNGALTSKTRVENRTKTQAKFKWFQIRKNLFKTRNYAYRKDKPTASPTASPTPASCSDAASCAYAADFGVAPGSICSGKTVGQWQGELARRVADRDRGCCALLPTLRALEILPAIQQQLNASCR